MDSHCQYKISNISVVYEDNWLLIVDKPSGLLTIPTPKNEARTLSSILNAEIKKKGAAFRLHPCHRLDKETSGLIIYAKGKSIQRKMMELFKKRKIKKTYLAFVQGIIGKDYGQIEKSIQGQYALTKFHTLERRNNFTITELIPLTGRTNQIRIHLKNIGHPLVGETKFAFRRDYLLRAKRICLHAQSLEFFHPATGKKVNINTALPADLEKFLRLHAN